MTKTDEDTSATYDTANTDGQSTTSSSIVKCIKGFNCQPSHDATFTRVSVTPSLPNNNTSYTAVLLFQMNTEQGKKFTCNSTIQVYLMALALSENFGDIYLCKVIIILKSY